jgi:hypothetical protein
MNAVRTRRILLTMIPALVAAASIGCRDIDVVTASYATLDEAREAGAIERGWIPEGLPPGAHDLREAHDGRSSRRWGLFSFAREEADSLRRLLEPDERTFAGMRCDAPPRIEWWPVQLRGALDDEKLRATGLRAYHAAAGDLVFAVNWNQGRGYYWSIAQ